MSWFQRHLNWTAGLAISLAFTFSAFGSLEALETVVFGLGALVSDMFFQSKFDHTELVFIFIGLGVCLPILVWTLKQKNRAPWWTFIAFVPFGWIAFLLLANRSEVVDTGYRQVTHWRHWGRLRKALCWIGIIAIAATVVFASRYNLPVLYETYEYREWHGGHSAGIVRVEVKDYSNAPLWVKIGSQYEGALFVVGVLLLVGAFYDRKNRVD